jgi:hypothetical protein
MKRLNALAALGIIVCSAVGAVQPKWETYSCEYDNFAKDITLTGRCHMQETEINGNFGYVLTWPSGNKVTVDYINSQSGNHIWRINGQPAVAFEITREHVRGFSLDLNQILEWQDRP